MAEREVLEVVEREVRTRCCADSVETTFEAARLDRVSKDLRILAHPVRLQILDILARNEGKVCVCDLEAVLPVKQPTVSHHLRLLREAGVIGLERRGLWAYYYLRKEVVEAMRGRVLEVLEGLH